MTLSDLRAIIISFGLLILSITVHEFAHSLAALRLGDPTARSEGRLSLNPFAHIDPFWTVLFPLMLFISTGGRFMFGAARPVPINYGMFRAPRIALVVVGASGPLANFCLAFIVSLLLRIGIPAAPLLTELAVINIMLGVFNLIPIPPLDGSRVVMGLLPPGAARRYAAVERFGFLIVMLCLYAGLFDFFLYPLMNLIVHALRIG